MGYTLGLTTYLLLTTMFVVNHIKISVSMILAHGSQFWSLLLSERLIAIFGTFGFILYRVVPRIYRYMTDRTPLLPPRFEWESGYWVRIGKILIWTGMLFIAGSLAFGIYLATQNTKGIPIGLATGLGLILLTAGVLLVEIMLLTWQNEQRHKT